jgi:hypothetical protein
MAADDAKEAAFIKARTRFEMANKYLEGGIADLKASVQKLMQKLLELKNDIEI